MRTGLYPAPSPRGDDLLQLACTCRATLRCSTCLAWGDLFRVINGRRALSEPATPPKQRVLICDLPEVQYAYLTL